MSDLHAAIMNLPCNELHAGSPSQEVQRAYGKGHCDARHAAAELANEYAASHQRLKEALERVFNASERACAGTAVDRWAGFENGLGEEVGTELDAALVDAREALRSAP